MTPPPWRRVFLALANLPLERVFLGVALAWGMAQVFIVPPFQVPDEGDHWFRAWALTDGQLTADRQGTITLPGGFVRAVDLYTRLASDVDVLPVSLEGQAGFSNYEDLFNGRGSSSPIRVISRVASYGPVGYLPQAAGIGLGRLVGASPLVCFYLARLGNLLASIALLFFAIRLAPFAKQLFVLLALMPMTMFEFASVSCDALTISGAMFFTALLLWSSRRSMMRRVDVAVVLAASALLLNVKPGYEALVLLILLVRPAQFGGRKRFLAFVVLNVLLVVGVYVVVILLTSTVARVQTGGGIQAQLLFVLQQPLGFLGIVWSNLEAHLLAWTLESIGVLGWFTIALPPATYLVVLLGGFGFFVGMREEVDLHPWQRALLAGAGLGAFFSIAVALFAFLQPTGIQQVSIQGRYLAPVWLLLLLSGYGIKFAQRQLGRLFMVSILLFVMEQNLQTLISVYHQ